MLVAAAAILFRDRWLPLIREARPVADAPVAEVVWRPLTAEGAARARSAVQSLGSRSGPVFTTVRAADLSAYVFEELSRGITPSAQNAEAAVFGDRIHIRASVKLSDFGGSSALGPLAGMLGDREPVEFGGTLEVLRPGLAQYRVQTLRMREFTVPQRLIPRLIRNVERGSRPEGLAADALPLVVPAHIADVRVGNGRVTLYKSVQ